MSTEGDSGWLNDMIVDMIDEILPEKNFYS